MAGDFCPEGGGMIHVIKMGQFMNQDVVTQWFWYVHEANIKRNCAIAAATSPPRGGMTEATFIIVVAKFFGQEF